MEWMENIVGIVGIIAVFTWLALIIYWDHKEKKLLIEKGLYKPKTPKEVLEEAEPAVELGVLLAGLILACTGAALLIGLYWAEVPRLWFIGGLVPGAIGIALLISYIILRKK